jgi:hypothetical protein
MPMVREAAPVVKLLSEEEPDWKEECITYMKDEMMRSIGKSKRPKERTSHEGGA